MNVGLLDLSKKSYLRKTVKKQRKTKKFFFEFFCWKFFLKTVDLYTCLG